MCEINFIMKTKGKIGEKELEIADALLLKSAESNSHGWGVYSPEQGITKEEKKYSYADLTKYLDSTFLLMHCRLATHASINHENTQPLEVGNAVLVHNGHLMDYAYSQKRSDSYKLLLALSNAYEETKDPVASLKLVLKEQTFYSIFAYFKDINRLFYVKDDNTSFSFFLIKNKKQEHYIIGATKAKRIKEVIGENTRRLYGFVIKDLYNIVSSKEPADYNIYEITKKGGVLRTEEKIDAPKKTEPKYVNYIYTDKIMENYQQTFGKGKKKYRKDDFGTIADDLNEGHKEEWFGF